MDIPDIRLVIVYSVPSSISQLYQVQYVHLIFLVLPFLYCILQMSGRAGRDGCTSVSHLIVNTRQVKNSKDVAVKTYCTIGDKKNNKENNGVCRRKFLLHHLGDDSRLCLDPATCCDQCTRDVPYMDLDSILQKGKRKRKQKHPNTSGRSLDKETVEEIRLNLMSERKKLLQSSEGLQMLGTQGFCHTSIIEEICKRCTYIDSIDDIKDIHGLRPHLFQPFYDVVMKTFSLNRQPVNS